MYNCSCILHWAMYKHAAADKALYDWIGYVYYSIDNNDVM